MLPPSLMVSTVFNLHIASNFLFSGSVKLTLDKSEEVNYPLKMPDKSDKELSNFWREEKCHFSTMQISIGIIRLIYLWLLRALVIIRCQATWCWSFLYEMSSDVSQIADADNYQHEMSSDVSKKITTMLTIINMKCHQTFLKSQMLTIINMKCHQTFLKKSQRCSLGRRFLPHILLKAFYKKFIYLLPREYFQIFRIWKKQKWKKLWKSKKSFSNLSLFYLLTIWIKIYLLLSSFYIFYFKFFS